MFARKLNILHWILASAFLLWTICSFSQNTFSSEEELKKEANNLFEQEDFAKAYPLFSQLLSVYPKDPQYNYKFGTCLLFSSNDKEKAIPYIEFAAKRQKQDVDKEVFFYLGKAYHLNYRFAEAIKSYNTFKEMASSRQVEKFDVDRQIEMCENGKRLLKNITELSVLEKKEVPIADFFRSYNLSEFNAKLILKPDELKTSIDKKKKDESLMYLAPDRNQIYYSSYGEDGKNGRDIYYVTRSADGELSSPTRVSDVINTKYDEDFPFLHPNGKTLYFCSKGHNSMGGYDIFKSEWNNSTQSWGQPVNMDFAINTPDDDILFISDSEDKTAYFSSKRESAEGYTSVYKIRLERKPLSLAIVKGKLTKDVGDQIAKATITVTKAGTDEVVGVFNTNPADGSYTLTLPNGGDFIFSFESDDFKKSSEHVVIPSQQEIKPMRQKIELANEDGQDKILINNEFDAQSDSSDQQLAIQYIKEKASLDVSPEEEKITLITTDENTTSAKEEDIAGSSKGKDKKAVTPVTNNDIINMAYEDAKETQKDANEFRRNSEAAQQISRQKNELSIQKYNEATDLMKSAEPITNQEEKMAQVDKATNLRKESEVLSKESALSLTLSNQMDALATAKQEQANNELTYAKDLDNAIKSGSNEKKMNELLARKEALDKNSEVLSATFPPDMSKEINETQAEASKSMTKYTHAQQNVDDLQKEAKHLRSEAETTKDESVKQNLNQQAEDMEKEAEVKKKEAEAYNLSAKQKQAESDSLKNNAAMTSSVMKEIHTSAGTTASSAKISKSDAAASPAKSNVTTTATTDQPTDKALAAKNDVQTGNNSNTASTPPVITSPYADVFISKQQEAEKKTNGIEKEEALAVVYQSWTDSLDNQILSLRKQLVSAPTSEDKKQLQNKIDELKTSADEKRQKAADSRNKVDNLKLQAALAEASTVSPQTTTATTNTATIIPNPGSNDSKKETSVTETVPVENLKGTENINNYYASKLKENENTPNENEYEKKSKNQILYQDWSSSLYDESLRLKKEGNSEKAGEAEKESKAQQTLSLQTGDELTRIKTEHPEFIASSNLTSSATKTETSSQPVKTTSSTTTTNTIGATTPVQSGISSTKSDDTSAVNASVSETQKTNISSPSNSVADKTTNPLPTSEAPETIKNKDEYTHYVSLRNESEWAKKNAERQFKQAEDLQKMSDQAFRESQDVSRQMSQTQDSNERQKLKDKSDALDVSALRNQAKADSIKSIAKNSEAESNAKRTESDLYLQSLDKAAYEEITTSTGGKTITGNTVQTANSTSALSASNETTPAGTIANPTTTEVVKSGNNPETKTISGSEMQASKDKTKTETLPKIVNTSTLPSSNESKTESENQPFQSFTPTPNSFTPFPSAVIKSSSPAKSSSEVNKNNDVVFDKLEFEGSAYSASKPIPVDAPMPPGLIFKVQIGAFKNPIPQDLFKGIKPITAETTPQGLKRYTAGLFTRFALANTAKGQVNELGYRDAFVVAFFNGKRISMNEALAKAKEAGENTDAGSALNGNTETLATGKPDSKSIFSNATDHYTGNSATGSIAGVTTNPSGSSSSVILSANSSAVIHIAQATDVKSIKGLFYTIQIGVFSKPVTTTQLYDISPLNSERTDNGLIRYTTGRFGDETKAIKAKNEISQKGISDAFVIAYRDGKRISLSSAKSIIDTEGQEALAKDKQENTFIPTDTTTTESSGKSLTLASNLGIVFKVQVGAFKEQVPIEIANKLLANSGRGIKTFKDDNGLLVYTIGEFMEYESANTLKTQLVGQGLTDAFVIAFKNGKKITATEGRELIKNK